MLAILPYKVVFSINWPWGGVEGRVGRVNYHLKNVCKRIRVATAPVLVDLFLLCCTCINKTYTRPYKLPRVSSDATLLLEREPYQEWQWASAAYTSFLGPAAHCSGVCLGHSCCALSMGAIVLFLMQAWQPKVERKCHLYCERNPMSLVTCYLGLPGYPKALLEFYSLLLLSLIGFPLSLTNYWELQTKDLPWAETYPTRLVNL